MKGSYGLTIQGCHVQGEEHDECATNIGAHVDINAKSRKSPNEKCDLDPGEENNKCSKLSKDSFISIGKNQEYHSQDDLADLSKEFNTQEDCSVLHADQ